MSVTDIWRPSQSASLINNRDGAGVKTPKSTAHPPLYAKHFAQNSARSSSIELTSSPTRPLASTTDPPLTHVHVSGRRIEGHTSHVRTHAAQARCNDGAIPVISASVATHASRGDGLGGARAAGVVQGQSQTQTHIRRQTEHCPCVRGSRSQCARKTATAVFFGATYA